MKWITGKHVDADKGTLRQKIPALFVFVKNVRE